MDIFLLHLNCLSVCTMKKRYIGSWKRERERHLNCLSVCAMKKRYIGREWERYYVFISYKNHIYVDKKIFLNLYPMYWGMLKMTVFVTCSLYLGCLVMGDLLLQCTWEGMEFLHNKYFVSVPPIIELRNGADVL